MAFSIANLLDYIGLNGITFWKALAIFFALLNLKHIPFAWHVRLPGPPPSSTPSPFQTLANSSNPQLRILNGLYRHIPFTSSRLLASKRSLGPSALFQPMILTSRASPLELDYNLHKSNSTYFADFDIARLHLFVRLCGLGLSLTSRELWLADHKRGPRRIRISMGGVHLNFRREIKPLQAFEMWTRLLCWDRKWFYVVTFFVEKGAVKPKGWTLQPWRNKGAGSEESEPKIGGKENGKQQGKEGEKEQRVGGSHPAIFASGIAKYVCKRGRLTVPPERIFQASGLLPPEPKEQRQLETPPLTDSPAVPMEGDALPPSTAAAAVVNQAATPSAADDIIDAALNAKPAGDGDDDGWDWTRVEQERLRGMEIAGAWSQTEGLGEEFWGDQRPALGKYWDWPGI